MKPNASRYVGLLATGVLLGSSTIASLFACTFYFTPGESYGNIEVYGQQDCGPDTVCAGHLSCGRHHGRAGVRDWAQVAVCRDRNHAGSDRREPLRFPGRRPLPRCESQAGEDVLPRHQRDYQKGE